MVAQRGLSRLTEHPTELVDRLLVAVVGLSFVA
jgi:hypothetical protein